MERIMIKYLLITLFLLCFTGCDLDYNTMSYVPSIINYVATPTTVVTPVYPVQYYDPYPIQYYDPYTVWYFGY